MCTDRRIGWEFLNPGAGYGGSCFPKDVRALVSQAEAVGGDTRILKTIDEVNERQKAVMPRKVLAHFEGDVRGKKIAVWGLAFKPGTDDIREAPSITLIESLLNGGAEVSVHDPEAMKNIEAIFGDQITYHDEKYAALKACDALVVMTDWEEYKDWILASCCGTAMAMLYSMAAIASTGTGSLSQTRTSTASAKNHYDRTTVGRKRQRVKARLRTPPTPKPSWHNPSKPLSS